LFPNPRLKAIAATIRYRPFAKGPSDLHIPCMSRAFVKEADDGFEDLPDRADVGTPKRRHEGRSNADRGRSCRGEGSLCCSASRRRSVREWPALRVTFGIGTRAALRRMWCLRPKTARRCALVLQSRSLATHTCHRSRRKDAGTVPACVHSAR
jgi:hypothetical protein